MAYIGNSPGVSSQRIVTTVTATAGQTTFTPSSGYTVGYLDVYLNGIKLINGTDYTASNGSTVVLTDAAALDDVVELMAYIPRGLSDGYTKSEADARYMDINEVIDTAQLRDGAVTAAKIAAGAAVPTQTGQSGKYLTTDGTTASWGTITQPTPAVVSDTANTSTGYFHIPTGTTAQRPGSPAAGYTRMNTTSGSLEFYDGSNWISTNLIPSITSISGTIYSGVTSTLTLSVANATETVDVKYYQGGTLIATDSAVAVTSGSASSTVPSAVYAKNAGDTISIQILNVDGTPSTNSISKTVVGLPTGGSVTTSGSYRIHAFTTSGTFEVPSGFTATTDYIIVGGGGSCGGNQYHSGGGGGGGVLTGTFALTQAWSHSITVGAGAAHAGNGQKGVNGSNSSAFSNVAYGGGGAGVYGGSGSNNGQQNGNSGGCGGGAGTESNVVSYGGSGTSGQGYAGGNVNGTHAGAAGGGGAGGVGGNGIQSPGTGGAGGIGKYVSWATAFGEGGYFGGGGGGSHTSPGQPDSQGGLGGGGDGNNTTGGAGAVNTGGGAGGPERDSTTNNANGGSGIVIIRYPLPS